MVYRKRPEEPHDKRPVLDAMGRCRKTLIETSSTLRPGSAVYMALDVVSRAIDAVAKLLTGDETYYHAGGSAQGSEDRKWQDSGTGR